MSEKFFVGSFENVEYGKFSSKLILWIEQRSWGFFASLKFHRLNFPSVQIKYWQQKYFKEDGWKFSTN